MDHYIDHFYVVEDLQERGQLDVQKFPNLTDAIAAYQALPTTQAKALGAQNTMPMPGSLDLVQCLGGENILVQDYTRVKGWQRQEVLQAIQAIQEAMPVSEPKEIRFIDSHYNTLFHIPDGQRIVLHRLDGERVARECGYIDDYHTLIGGGTYHNCEFAERCREAGIVFLPEYPRPNDILDSYEIYQLRDLTNTNYAFRNYEFAKRKIKPQDYRREYASNLAPKVDLNTLYAIHNADNRPMSRYSRSLSMSDIIVTHRSGKSQAFYVNDIGFQEIHGFCGKAAKTSRITDTETQKSWAGAIDALPE